MSAKLNKCPCGEIPDELHIIEGNSFKWAWVSGSCCNEWSIEFRTEYNDIGSDKCMESAITVWNGATRGKK